ncbi:hypothetical protein [Schlesneria sp. T3-172]|uniref:hypothetical protein n=1 Tax=Schlesneria sphaerica TaxID=3373610 RepID=UPI0037C793D5
MSKTVRSNGLKRPWLLSASRDLCDRLEYHLSRILQSDLAAEGAATAYIVLLDETEYEVHPDIGGLSCPELGWMLWHCIPEYRRNGIGPTVLLAADRSDYRHVVLTCRAIHEMAHLLSSPSMLRNPDSPPETKVQTGISLSETLRLHPDKWPAYSGKPAWATHGLQFLRAILHLQERMYCRGWEIPLSYLGDWKGYGYRTPIATYLAALQDEIDSRRDEPIRQILSSRCPKDFLKMWATDLAAVAST